MAASLLETEEGAQATLGAVCGGAEKAKKLGRMRKETS